MEKVSKVKTVEMLAPWVHSASGNTNYPHKVLFENGEIAIANKQKENAFTVGQEIKYKITGQDGMGNNKFSEVKENNFSGGKEQNTASFALSYAKDMAIAQIEKGKELTSDHVLTVAAKFNEWLKENK